MEGITHNIEESAATVEGIAHIDTMDAGSACRTDQHSNGIAHTTIGLRNNDDLHKRGLQRYKRVITADNWKPVHEKILSYKVLNLPHAQIAKVCSVSEQTVRNVVHSPYFQTRLQESRGARLASEVSDQKGILEEAKGVLGKNIIPAVQKMVEIMHNGQSADRIQLDAAQAILDRAGLAKSTIVENISRNYSPEEIQSARDTILEIESITARVSTSQSKFVLPNPKDTDAPGEVLPTSSDRPETLPA